MAWRGTITANSSGSVNIPIPLYLGSRVGAVPVTSSKTFGVDSLKMWVGEFTSTTTHALDALSVIDDNGDAFGETTLNFLVVYGIWVENASTNTAALVTCGNAAATQFFGDGGLASATSVLSLKQGDGRWIHINSAGTSTTGAEDFKVTLSGASGKYRVAVFGTT